MTYTNGAPRSPQSQILDQYLRDQYALIRYVHDHMDEIIAVASHLTPIEDLQDFKDQVQAVYDQLAVLTPAATLLLAATDAGRALLDAADAAAQRTLLELGDIATHGVADFASIAQYNTLVDNLAALQALLNTLTVSVEAKADGTALASLTTTVDALATADSAQVTRIETLEATVSDPATGLTALAVQVNEATTQVSLDAGQVAVLTAQVNALAAELDDPTTGLAAETIARETLATQVQELGDTLTAQATDIVQLQTDASSALDGVAANATALDALTTRVTVTEEGIAAQSSLVAALTARADSTDGTLAGQASALSTLSTEVASNGLNLTAAADSITALRVSLAGAGNLLPNSAFEADLAGWTFASIGTGWEAGSMTRDLAGITGFPAGVHTLGITSATVVNPTGDAGVYATNVPVAGGRDYILSGYLAAEQCTASLQWRELDALGNEVGYGEVGTTTAAPIASLAGSVRVQLPITTQSDTAWLRVQLWAVDPATTAGPGQPSRAWLFRPMLEEATAEQTSASPWVPSAAGLDAKYASATEALSVEIDVHDGEITTLFAQYVLTLDVNGRVTGWTFLNDGTTGLADFVADRFRITAPAGVKSVEFADGVLMSKSATHARYMGVEFGEGSAFIDWYGPKPVTDAAGALTANGIMWMKKDGSAYFGGALAQNAVLVYLSGSGLNQMWAEYSHFWNSALPTLTKNGTLTTSYDSTVSFAADNTGSLKAVVSDATGNISNSWLYFGNSTTDYSTLVINKKYIVSGSFKSTVANTKVRFGIKTSDGTLHDGPDIDLGPANTIKRVSCLLDLAGFAGGVGELYVYLNRQGTTTAYTVWLDRLMVETQIGSLADPSDWTPGRANRLVVKAQADATLALATLTEIASDNLLTPGEKPTVIRDRDMILSQQTALDTQATAFAISTEKTSYDSAVTALTAYLATLTAPVLWTDLSGNTTIVGTTFRQKFLDVFAAQQTLQAKIATVAKAAGDTAQTAADAANLLASSRIKVTKQFALAGAALPSGLTGTRYGVASAEGGTASELTASALDPQLAWAVGLPPSKCYVIVARVKLISAAANWQGTVYFDNGTHSYSSSFQKTVAAPKVGVWTTVVWDMRTLTSGAGDYVASANIANLRLDLVEPSGSIIDVDWIAYGMYGDVAQGDIDAVNAAVTTAQADATNALNQLTNISSDNLLTPGEKPIAIRDRDAIVAEQAGLDAQATAYGVSTEKTSYDAAVSALTAYLATLTSPLLWTDLAGNTTIVGTTFRQKFLDVYAARIALLQKIADVVTFGNLAGRGVNLMPDNYSILEAATLPTYTKSATATVTRDTGVTYFGFPTLKVAASGADAWVSLTPVAGTYNIPVTGGKSYLFSVLVRCDQASKNIQMYASDDSPSTPTPVPWTQATSAVANTWTRLTQVVTPAAGATRMYVRVDNEGGAGVNMWFTGFMVEEQVGAQTTPSVYCRGISASAAIAAQAAADAAQASASNAQTDATSALNSLVDISTDNLLTPAEKKVVITDYNSITAEQAGIDTQATDFGIIPEKTTYDTAVSALTSYLATLTAPTLWSNMAGNTTIVRTTFRTKFLDVYSARQALLNAIYEQGKLIANGKVGAVGDNLIPNPSFNLNAIGAGSAVNLAVNDQGCDGWFCGYNGISSGGTTAITTKWNNVGYLQCSVGNPTIPTGQFAASRFLSLPIPVRPGASYLAKFADTQSLNGSSMPAGVTAFSRMVIDWQTAAGTHISYSILQRARGAAAVVETEFVAPATAYRAVVWLDVLVQNTSGASWTHDSTVALATNFQWVQLTRKMDTTAQLPMLMYGNGRAKVPTVISYSASAGTPATATVNVAAFSIISGRTIAYSAMSMGLSHAAGTVTYFLYCDDPTAAGGARTLVATLNGDDVYASEGRLYIGDVTVVFPASGTSSGGGGRLDSCVCIDQFLAPGFMAMEAATGDRLDLLDIPQALVPYTGPIQRVRFVDAECVRLVTAQGARLDLSASTPFDTLDERSVLAEHMAGEYVVTDRGPGTPLEIDRVVQVLHLGWCPVAHISAGGVSYAAGRDPLHRIYSHNTTKP